MRVKNKLLYFIPIVIVYVIGMFIDILEVDEAQYAEMSREMLQTGKYVEVYNHGLDYLDKPPLLFWVTTLSYRAFGISNFTYKLPSVLFTLLGLFATYRLGKLLYNERVGFYAALILSTSQAWFLINHDVRTDTILAACTAVALWQLCEFLNNSKFIHIIYGAVGVAGAMMTKGPIGLMVPGLAIGFHLLVRREWKQIFQWQWLAMLVIVMLCLLPMMMGLYRQYDLQPGKLIDGMPIGSGLKFFFWTQSFGRLTGENYWKDDTTVLFFTHTFLWAFLPWCVLFVVSWVRATLRLIKAKFTFSAKEEAITWGGFIFPFIAFSLSHYKLPHYIFVILPLAAISTAYYVYQLIDAQEDNGKISIKYIQFFIGLLLFILGFLLNGLYFPTSNFLVWGVWALALILMLLLVVKGKSEFQRLFLPSVTSAVALNFILNVNFYPQLSYYASASRAAQFVATTPEAKNYVAFKKVGSYGTDFFSERIIPEYDELSLIQREWSGKIIWIYTEKDGLKEIRQAGIEILQEKVYDHFHISKLSINFVRPSTRQQYIDHRHLIKVKL
jgi:4-amino-4-deoxy-L-arabinose transferase-like glycosyltransferase